MTSARQDLHSTARQLSMALDPVKLQGMTQAERNAVIARLANLPDGSCGCCRDGERR